MKRLVLASTLGALLLAGQSRAVPEPSPLDPLFTSDQDETRAALLIKDGQVIAKRYGAGYSDANRFISWSMAKSVTAVLIGELVAEGKLRLDEPVPFAEWQKPGDPRAAITLRHLLAMSSGLDHTENYALDDGGAVPKRSDTTANLFVDGTENVAARALAKGLEAAPGTKYEYSSMTSVLLSELITRQLTKSQDAKTRARAYQAFANERLFTPAGITSAVLDFDGAGTQLGGSIIYMTLEDWGRFGQLLLNGQGIDGGQAIAPDWLRYLRTPAVTDANYGGHIWLNRKRPEGRDQVLFPGTGPDSLFAATGHLGQWVIVSPDQNTVLVRLGKTDDAKRGPVNKALGSIMAAQPLVK